jgi:DNA-binding NarL/FixJ family response regulator
VKGVSRLPKRILIVDDHAAVRRAVTHLFEMIPTFEICGEAENGRIAIEKARELRPDAIVIDLSMPVMNGLQATRILRSLMPAVPILMYTSFTNVNLAEEALAAGVTKVASKTSPPEVLVQELQSLLADAA